ncbi:exonuclease tos isoform X2 [Osmia lignaria lignaria]|uniref:exonuclease tos isoform X2 n=1 Tax=Osmia lignaria lignaria TaxID=1437193 RepID=UPI001478B5D0|nr:exonuclease 1 isoform X2 [Osmia lignaria]
MGITGLLPFLEKCSERTNINKFSGGTVAIDTYCWLHRGVFACADKLSMGQQTKAYINYCMKQIHMLLAYKIKPILVFDGRHLPAKAQTEAKRREARETNRRKAAELMQMGQHAEGRNLLRRSVDITHEMALELIKECHKMNIDCIVAPYEADAQLAYLNINGIADVVITEDSDLTLFGCKKIFFKMDAYGNGLLVQQDLIHLAMGVSSADFSLDEFRYMCILSGCDYLSSLPGIGLSKARKFIRTNKDCNIHRALTRLGSYLNMKSLVVTQEYRDAFILADITFKHQLVFCPLQRKQVRLNPPMSDVTEEQLYYAGTETSPDIALQLAYGNCDPFTLKMLHNFDPDKTEILNSKSNNTWRQKMLHPQHISIWSKKYVSKQNLLQSFIQKKDLTTWPNTVGKEAVLNTNRLRNACLVIEEDHPDCKELNQKEILDIYEDKNTKEIKSNLEIDSVPSDEEISPVLIRRTNLFAKQPSSTKTSPSLLFKHKSRVKGRHIMRLRRTIVNEEVVTESKFFAKPTNETDSNVVTNDNTLCPTDNSNKILLEKENINKNESKETNDIKLQALMITDEVKTDTYRMDVDEEHNASNECKATKYSNSSFNCDLMTSPVNVQISEVLTHKTNINESCNLNSSLTVSEVDTDFDFLIQQGDISTLSNSSFKWSDTRQCVQINKKAKCDKYRNSKSRTVVNNTRRSQQLCSVQRQQGLLSMYGFEKKKLA